MFKALKQRIRDWLTPEPLPVLTKMPKHVADLQLDPWLLLSAMEGAVNENPAVDRGYSIPRA